ncbi:nose resistant to fluoxetine protein 6 [Caerostris extrusa]|uniref:Nose resistant to fluoxetine protein 6 n=1 Tax=Caerostris extrusa TaxID=172846 RepID=A0AAV4SYL6_CAEEX|nr:nose resistant to fluoxetine protein 6 [Caerostris extrusa]
MSLPLSIGVCLPDSCDSTERLSNFTENLNLTGPALIIAKKIFSAMNMTKLICQNPPKEFSTGAIFVMVLISVFVLLVVIGSSITAYEYFTEPEKDITSNANSSHYPLVNSDVETGSSGWMETSKSF